MTVNVNWAKYLGRSYFLWENECTIDVLINGLVAIMLPRHYVYTHRLMLLLARVREVFVLFCFVM